MRKSTALMLIAASLICLGSIVVSLLAMLGTWKTPEVELVCAPGKPGKPFLVSAFVRGHRPGQPIQLILPAGLQFAEGHSARRVLPGSGRKGYAQVTWRVIAGQAGEYPLVASAPGIGSRIENARVYEPCICFLD